MKLFPCSQLLALALVVALLEAPFSLAELEIEACGLQINRLPPLFVPEKYQLTLEPNVETLAFSGSVDILSTFTGDLGCLKLSLATVVKQICVDTLSCGWSYGLKLKRRILLNIGKNLELEDLKVFQVEKEGGVLTQLDVESMCIDRASQLIGVVLARRLHKGDKISIQAAFKGQIARESRGLYQSLNRIEGPDGGAQLVDGEPNANTHFFPADARSTFPCFDQPDLKANFALKLIHDKGLMSVSNTKVLSEQVDAETQKKIVQFAETPKMSTYLFAFAVGRYETVRCQAEGMARPVVTAYAPLGRSQEATFTLQTVCKAIPLIERYFLKEFPLNKLDLVVTRQMRDPARENWGMMVMTEEFLLTDDDTTNILRVEIAKLAVHNVLHHWFGDLVSAKWWDDQWIFDGFAIWRSHLVAAAIYPEFDYNFNYLLRLQSPILDAHSSATVRPIKTYQDLSANDELALFDANTYNKAAALYQMIQGHLGEFLLRDSLAMFVTRHAYGVGDAKNLTDAILQASGLDMEEQIRAWTDQAGVPVISVERVSKSEIELKQERLAETLSGEAKRQRWSIPVDVLFSDEKGHQSVVRVNLEEASQRLKVPVWFDTFNQAHWFKLNPKFSGFYRVNYAQNVLKYHQSPIEQKLLSPEDRFNVIDDLRALVNLNKLDTKSLEEVLKWYGDETSGGVLSGLAVVVQNLAQKESSGRVAEIVHQLFDQVYELSKFKIVDGQTHSEMNGRADALLELIRYDYETAVEEALQVFEATDVHLAPFLRKPVYLAVLRRGSDSQVEELFERLGQTKSAYERQILVSGLVAYLEKDDEKLKERLMATITI